MLIYAFNILKTLVLYTINNTKITLLKSHKTNENNKNKPNLKKVKFSLCKL